MSRKADEQRIERWFDGESADGRAVEDAMVRDKILAAHVEALRRTRAGVQAVAARETINDAQFGAFMAGIRDGLAVPRRRWGGVWTYASVAAALLVVVACTLLVLMGGSGAVKAQPAEVETYSTDIKDATVNVYKSDNGKAATVWVNTPSGDVW